MSNDYKIATSELGRLTNKHSSASFFLGKANLGAEVYVLEGGENTESGFLVADRFINTKPQKSILEHPLTHDLTERISEAAKSEHNKSFTQYVGLHLAACRAVEYGVWIRENIQITTYEQAEVKQEWEILASRLVQTYKRRNTQINLLQEKLDANQKRLIERLREYTS